MALQFGQSGSTTLKALTIGVIILLLLVPLSMLRGLVHERTSLRDQAYARVAEGWGGHIVLGGPILVVPTERVVSDGERTRVLQASLYILPSKLDVDLDLKLEPEARKVGVYSVPVYLSDSRFHGEFDLTAVSPLLTPDTTYHWAKSRVLLPMSQVRSLREVRQARFAGQMLTLGPAKPSVLQGIEAPIDLSNRIDEEAIAFEFHTVVAGSRELSLLPLGSETQASIRSNWPHPAFQGAFLPARRTIGEDGFTAHWQVLELNRAYRHAWIEGEIDASTVLHSAFGVAIYQSVDVYQRGERAVKYALLFIALTFLTFFAWEQLSRTRLHPLQYLLVGLAMSMFYVLLIALSEHLAFAAAYLIAASALVVLIGVYMAGAVGRRKVGATAAAAMSLVYGVLYVLVLSEDYALLLGALTLFAALAAVMLVTRKVDWYRIGTPAGP